METARTWGCWQQTGTNPNAFLLPTRTHLNNVSEMTRRSSVLRLVLSLRTFMCCSLRCYRSDPAHFFLLAFFVLLLQNERPQSDQFSLEVSQSVVWLYWHRWNTHPRIATKRQHQDPRASGERGHRTQSHKPGESLENNMNECDPFEHFFAVWLPLFLEKNQKIID